MKNRDMPAAPLDVKQAEYLHRHIEEEWLSPIGLGLTKREHAAVKIMAELIGASFASSYGHSDEKLAEWAVEAADALFDALESDE